MENRKTVGLIFLIIVVSGLTYVYIGYREKERIQDIWDDEVAYYTELAESEDWLYLKHNVSYMNDDPTDYEIKYTEHMLEWYRDNWGEYILELRNVTRQGMWDEMQGFLEWQEGEVRNPDVVLHIDETVRVIFFLRGIPETGSTRLVGWISPK